MMCQIVLLLTRSNLTVTYGRSPPPFWWLYFGYPLQLNRLCSIYTNPPKTKKTTNRCSFNGILDMKGTLVTKIQVAHESVSP